MGLPRTFVGFSSTDIHYYRLMQAWKNNDRIDFNFTDCQLSNEINSENEEYIKRKCLALWPIFVIFLHAFNADNYYTA
jgi:hypothetical protein